MVLAQVEFFEAAEIAETRDPTDLILGEMQLFKVQVVQIFDASDFIHAK